MASVCSNCSTRLSFLQKLTGGGLCPTCGSQAKQERREAEDQYQQVLSGLIGGGDMNGIEGQLPAIRERAGLDVAKARKIHLEYYRRLLDAALEDDVLTEDEEDQLVEVGSVLGIANAGLDSDFGDYRLRMYVARVNDGRIPVLPDPTIVLKRGEVAHMSADAQIMKEVVRREYQGGYRGFSFRVAKGVRFHTGSTRGKSVVVGSEIVPVDAGVLTITSQRAVYACARQSLEFPYGKLITMNVYTDGIQFLVSNRKTVPLLKLENGMGNLVAATVNAACQRL